MNSQTSEKITRERTRQNKKWGVGQFTAMPPERVLAVLMEEVGELAQALLEWNSTIDGARRVEEELIQVAAVAAGWIDDCFTSTQEPKEEK